MNIEYDNQKSALRKIKAVCTIIAIAATTFAAVIGAQSTRTSASKSATRLTEDQRILHLLNRIGFGARPGDVERIEALGIENYINQQLAPERLSDQVADEKIKVLPTLTMTVAELYEKYPQPGQPFRQLQR